LVNQYRRDPQVRQALLDYANLTNKTGGTGTYTTSGDYCAPIFYDSNNTAYYVDPASNSVLNTINSRSITYLMYYQVLPDASRWTPCNGFTYSVNAPYTGPVARFSTGGSYDLWLNAPYTGHQHCIHPQAYRLT
jgi:hypothetical protein